MRKRRIFVSLIIVMLICISSLSAEASFYVAAINPNIGVMTSENGTSSRGLAIHSIVSSRYQPFVIVVNNMHRSVSDFPMNGLRAANSVFIINDGKFEAFWNQNNKVELDYNNTTISYAERGLHVSVVGEDREFFTLKLTDNGQSSDLSFEISTDRNPMLYGSHGNYLLRIPEGYRSPIRLNVDGARISLAR